MNWGKFFCSTIDFCFCLHFLGDLRESFRLELIAKTLNPYQSTELNPQRNSYSHCLCKRYWHFCFFVLSFQVKSLINARGKDANGDSHEVMNLHVTIGSTQELNHSNVATVIGVSHDRTTWRSIWSDMYKYGIHKRLIFRDITPCRKSIPHPFLFSTWKAEQWSKFTLELKWFLKRQMPKTDRRISVTRVGVFWKITNILIVDESKKKNVSICVNFRSKKILVIFIRKALKMSSLKKTIVLSKFKFSQKNY